MSEKQESIIRSEAILMMSRNNHKEYMVKRVMKRFIKCMKRG